MKRTSLASVTFLGAIDESKFHHNAFKGLGDLRDKYLAGGGGPGIYTTLKPGKKAVWEKQ